MERSQRPDVRNPLLALESAKDMQNLPKEAKQALRALLMDIRKEAQAKAEKCWRQHKGPMALYWKCLSVYSGHMSRMLREQADTGKIEREAA
jgi:hypothetical protein